MTVRASRSTLVGHLPELQSFVSRVTVSRLAARDSDDQLRMLHSAAIGAQADCMAHVCDLLIRGRTLNDVQFEHIINEDHAHMQFIVVFRVQYRVMEVTQHVSENDRQRSYFDTAWDWGQVSRWMSDTVSNTERSSNS